MKTKYYQWYAQKKQDHQIQSGKIAVRLGDTIITIDIISGETPRDIIFELLSKKIEPNETQTIKIDPNEKQHPLFGQITMIEEIKLHSLELKRPLQLPFFETEEKCFKRATKKLEQILSK